MARDADATVPAHHPVLSLSSLGTESEKFTDDPARAAIEDVKAAFKHALERNPAHLVEEFWNIAGAAARVRVVGRSLHERLLKALAHLRVESSAPEFVDFTIDLWDEELTGITSPDVAYADIRGKWAVGEGEFVSSNSGRFAGYRLAHSRTWLDRERRHIVGSVSDPSRLILFERGKPLQFLLNLWLSDRGLQVIHAGLVSRNGNGVLFPGTGGAGKSTSSLSCLKAGFSYLGDDYIALGRMPDGAFAGHSLYNTTWLEPAHLTRFPDLVPYAQDGLLPGARKKLLHLVDVYPDRLESAVPIRALALPRIVDAPRATWHPATKAAALLKIVPSSLLHIVPRPGPEGMDRLGDLVSATPCYWLELGRDLSSIPDAVSGILEHVAQSLERRAD